MGSGGGRFESQGRKAHESKLPGKIGRERGGRLPFSVSGPY